MAGDLGSVGLITVPIFGPPQLPDLSPYMDAIALERALLTELLQELAQYAARAGTCVLIEPLNRYETHLLRTLADGVTVCAAANSQAVALMADMFHMNIEEADMAASLQAASRWIRHVHLADSNRLLPGLGHIDFVTPLRTLHQTGYQGDLSLECNYPGGRPDQEALLQCGQHLLRCLAEAGLRRNQHA